MSRAYRVTWVTVASNVSTDDTLTMNLSLLGILPEDEMAALLREELARRGWTPGEGGALTGSVQGLDASLSPDATKVTVTARAEGDVSARARDSSGRRAGPRRSSASRTYSCPSSWRSSP